MIKHLCTKASLLKLWLLQIDGSCPNDPDIIYFRFRILAFTFQFYEASFGLLDRRSKISLRIFFGNYFGRRKLKRKTNKTYGRQPSLMHYTFSDTFFAGVEFSSVYRLGNLFCTVPFRKITFLIDQVGFFLSIDSIFCSLKTGIHNVPSTNSQSRKMQSHDRRS